MRKQPIELTAAALVGALFAALFFQGIGYSGQSAYMPGAATALGFAMCCLWALHAARLIIAGDSERYNISRSQLAWFGVFLVVAALYVVGILWIGFFTATIIMVPTFAVVLGYRNWSVLFFTTAGFIAILYVVFRVLLSIPLPEEAIFTMLGD